MFQIRKPRRFRQPVFPDEMMFQTGKQPFGHLLSSDKIQPSKIIQAGHTQSPVSSPIVHCFKYRKNLTYMMLREQCLGQDLFFQRRKTQSEILRRFPDRQQFFHASLPVFCQQSQDLFRIDSLPEDLNRERYQRLMVSSFSQFPEDQAQQAPGIHAVRSILFQKFKSFAAIPGRSQDFHIRSPLFSCQHPKLCISQAQPLIQFFHASVFPLIFQQLYFQTAPPALFYAAVFQQPVRGLRVFAVQPVLPLPFQQVQIQARMMFQAGHAGLHKSGFNQDLFQAVRHGAPVFPAFLVYEYNLRSRCVDRHIGLSPCKGNPDPLFQLFVTDLHLAEPFLLTGQFPQKQHICQRLQQMFLQSIRPQAPFIQPCQIFIDFSF